MGERHTKLCINADYAVELIQEIDFFIIKSPHYDRKLREKNTVI